MFNSDVTVSGDLCVQLLETTPQLPCVDCKMQRLIRHTISSIWSFNKVLVMVLPSKFKCSSEKLHDGSQCFTSRCITDRTKVGTKPVDTQPATVSLWNAGGHNGIPADAFTPRNECIGGHSSVGIPLGKRSGVNEILEGRRCEIFLLLKYVHSCACADSIRR